MTTLRRTRPLLALVGGLMLLAVSPAPAGAGAASSVAGGGAAYFPDDSPVFPGDRVQLDVTARDLGDAGAKGRFTAIHHTAAGGVFTQLQGTVDCLAVEGDIAVATGVITHGFTGIGVDPVGTRVSFEITDAEPDVFAVDLEFFSGHSIAPCSSDPILTFTVQQGNYIVRD